MRVRKRRHQSDADRATERREQARQVAGQSGEALKVFAEEAGGAAKDFLGRTRDATKDLVGAIEQASQKAAEPAKPKRRRGRKLVGTVVLVGIGVAVATSDRVRNVITGGRGHEPWEPSVPDEPDGSVASPSASTATG